MWISHKKDLSKLPPEVLGRLDIFDHDKIGFYAEITTNSGKVIGPLRFDYAFDAEAFSAYIAEDPRQLVEGDPICQTTATTTAKATTSGKSERKKQPGS